MFVKFSKGDVHTGRKGVIEDVTSNTLGLCLFHEQNIIIHATRNQRVDNSKCSFHWPIC